MKNPKPTILELLLGRTVEIGLPGKSGRRKVSKKWFDAMVAEGKIRPASARNSEPTNVISGSKLLVRMARVGPIGFLGPLLDKFPQLIQADPNDWDFFLCIGSVCAGLVQHSVRNLPENPVARRLVAEELVEWDPDALGALVDCEEFVTRMMDALLKDRDRQWSDALSKAIGYWVFLNVLRRRADGDSDLELASIAGTMALKIVEGVWDRQEGS